MASQPSKQSPTHNLATITWVKNESGKPPLIREYLEGTSESFKAGDLVVFDRSEDGVVALPNTSGVPTTQAILGVALKDGTNVTSGFANIPVLIPQAGDVFSAGVASDEDTVVTPAGDDRGRLYGLIKTSSTYNADLPFVVDNGNTTWVKIVDLHPQDVQKQGGQFPDSIPTMASGDRVLFQFLPSVLSNTGAQA